MTRSAAASLGPVRFSDLRAHLVRDAVILVDSALALAEVADVVARDDKALVGAWVEAGKLSKPPRELLERWENTEGDVALSIVVQPFVLVQDLPPSR